MTNFKIHSDEAFSLVFPDMGGISIKTSDRKRFLRAKDHGASIKDWWVELEGKVQGRKPLPDLSHSSDCHIAMSPKAYAALQVHLTDYGEFLPVPFRGEVYHLFRCLNRIDKVDTDKSSLDEFNTAIGLYFLPEDVDGQLIWATRYGVSEGIFCSDELKKLIENNGLTGLKFNRDLASIC